MPSSVSSFRRVTQNEVIVLYAEWYDRCITVVRNNNISVTNLYFYLSMSIKFKLMVNSNMQILSNLDLGVPY